MDDIKPGDSSSSSSSKDGWGKPGWFDDDDDEWGRPGWRPSWKPGKSPPQWKPNWSISWSGKSGKSGTGSKSWSHGDGWKSKGSKKKGPKGSTSWWSSSSNDNYYGWTSKSSKSFNDEGWTSMSYITDISSDDSSDSSHDVWPHVSWTADHWSISHGLGKSGKSRRSKSSGGWNAIGGLKPKSSKDEWLGMSEDAPGKELIYDEDTLPSWHAGWPPLDAHISSSGKSGKSGGGHSWSGGGEKSKSSYDTSTEGEEYVTPQGTSSPILGATKPPVSGPILDLTKPPVSSGGGNSSPPPNPILSSTEPPVSSDGGNSSPPPNPPTETPSTPIPTYTPTKTPTIPSSTEPPVGSSLDGDPNAKYWIYTDENGVQTCEYSLTIPDGIGSLAWARESKKECCEYAIGIGSINLQGCDGVRSASPPKDVVEVPPDYRNEPAPPADTSKTTLDVVTTVNKKPSLGAQFLGDHPHGHNNDISKGDRSGATSKSAKSADISIDNPPMPSVSLTKSKSAKSKSSKNWDKKYGIGPPGVATSSTSSDLPSHPSGTASDVKYSEGLTDSMTYSGYKQKTSGSDPSSQSEEPMSSSASYISSTFTSRILLSGLAVLGWYII